MKYAKENLFLLAELDEHTIINSISEWKVKTGGSMAFFDFSLEELRTYKPERMEPDDFDSFWAETLSEVRKYPMNPELNKVDEPMDFIDVYDVTFPGFSGQAIKGWLLTPKNIQKRLPCVVEYIGYGGGRGKPLEHLAWVNAGYAHFIMDNRGQGSSWSSGDTPDFEIEPSNSQFPGFMTRGVLNPATYYYKRLICDAVRAVELVKLLPFIDKDRIAITGGSQGGGLTIAVAGLMPEIKVAMPEVPFLCNFQRSVTLINSLPYHEIVNYLRVHRDKEGQVFRTLSYFDGMNFAYRANAKTIFSTALMDETCPPSTVFAAYNYWQGEKEIKVYPYNQHDGGGIDHLYYKISFLRSLWF